MGSKYWIKLYIEILDDPKMGRLTDRLAWRTIQLFLLAGDINGSGKLPSVDDMSWRLRLKPEELETDLADLASSGIVHKDNDHWIVTKFEDRQAPVSDAERMRRYRGRKQKALYYGNEPSDDTVTIRNVDTDIDTESDIDTDKEEEVNPDGIYADLSVAFCNKTKLPELTGGPQAWYESLNRMGEAGVQPIDIEKAVDILRDKNYSIVRLSSVENTAIGEMSKRVGKKPDSDSEEARSRYVSGEYADFIEH